ncbi:hypothetical protein HRbin30_02608 [bacterium HR30]|jgi:uncharacterized protein YecE (DUF72 family)|nr:hypothetical protein HRbin30_02608 [bacterium HR30]
MIRVGCCGWAKAQAVYTAELDAVEVQQTFYEPPQLRTLERWRRTAPSDFVFTVKCFQLVTHERRSPTYRRLRRHLPDGVESGHFRDNEVVRAAWKETIEAARALRAPIVLVQTPARFEPTAQHLARLRAFAAWESGLGFKIAFEPRGPAWTGQLTDQLCRELGWLRAGDPFVLPPPDPEYQPVAYFRLHGRTGYRYTFSESDFQQIARWAKAYAHAWVFFNNQSMWNDAVRFRTLVTARKR